MMSKLFFNPRLLLFSAVFLFHANALLGQAQRYHLDLEQSQIAWTGEKVTGSHSGTLALAHGFVTADGGLIQAATIQIDMNSLACTDLEGESKESIENHLKNDDFFGVDQHPIAQFDLKLMQPIRATGENAPNFSATGEVRIKGISQPISFPVRVHFETDRVTLMAQVTVDRTKFGIKYGSGSFFDNLGDRAIYDDFTIDFSLIAVK
jgi:polyisoprenoid-binding protein YceI